MKIEEIRELLSQDSVRLWSLQEEAAWETAKARGQVRADGRRICFADFRPAYKWLIEQMNVRIDNYPGCYPVWAWAEKPDMRQAHGPSGTKLVRICFEMPLEHVLFSDFSSWHCVLNNYFLSKSEHADNCFEAFCRRTQARVLLFGSPDANLLIQARIKRSWQHIFDFEWLSLHPEWHGEEIYLQATTAAISVDSIIDVEYFIAR